MVVISWSRVCCTNEAQWRQRLEHGEAIAALQHRVLVKIADAAAFEQSRFWRSTCYTNLNLISTRTLLPGFTVYRISLRYKRLTMKQSLEHDGFAARRTPGVSRSRHTAALRNHALGESLCFLWFVNSTLPLKLGSNGIMDLKQETMRLTMGNGQWQFVRSACEMKMQTLTITE